MPRFTTPSTQDCDNISSIIGMLCGENKTQIASHDANTVLVEPAGQNYQFEILGDTEALNARLMEKGYTLGFCSLDGASTKPVSLLVVHKVAAD
jgi:hypothetical protein